MTGAGAAPAESLNTSLRTVESVFLARDVMAEMCASHWRRGEKVIPR